MLQQVEVPTVLRRGNVEVLEPGHLASLVDTE